MATVNVVLFQPDFIGDATVISGEASVRSENITTSASSQTSTLIAEASDVCRLTVSGGSVYVQIGLAPTASNGQNFLLLDGSTEVFSMGNGSRVAVVNA